MSKNLPSKIHIPEIDANFLLIPAGAFYVGRSRDEDSPRRLAAITKPFYMQETLVTQRQYQAITGTNPSNFTYNLENPVEQVNWPESVDFAQKLSQQTGLVFRLPTEMEWEYAARGGDGDKYLYAGSNKIDEVGWYNVNSRNQTRPVKQKKPNGYGLYDMTGNVSEWCLDGYYSKYPNEELIDYQGIAGSASYLVNRGGSWFSRAQVASRDYSNPAGSSSYLGFRLVLEGPKE